MAYHKLLKLFFFVTFIFYAQPSFTMDDSKEENVNIITRGVRSLYGLMATAADAMDHLHGIDLYISSPSLLMQQSASSFFPGLSDEMAIKVFSYLYGDKKGVENLCAVALTCQHGYQLMQDSSLWKYLTGICLSHFNHLPKEYISALIQETEARGLSLVDILLQRLITDQAEERKRLSQMLSQLPAVTGPEASSVLMRRINRDVKLEWFNKLGSFDRFEKGLNGLEYEEGLEITKNPPFKRYFVQKRILDSINSEIITECLKFMRIEVIKKNIDGVETDYRHLSINLSCSLTRLTQEGIGSITKALLSDHDEITCLDLSYNHLRWIPDSLFSIEKIIILTLNNNRLCYLPKTIEGVKNHLRFLHLGNYEAFYGPVASYYGENSRRTSGNIFRTVPSAILKLKKLEGLEMASVQLDEFSDDEIYEALPELNHLNVAHNNLRNIPKSNFQGRDIFYMSSYDNPASPGSTFSCYPDLFFDACSRSHSNAMTFIHHHPVGFTLGAATLLPSLFLGPLYLEHGPLLWEYFRLLQRGASNALWGVSLK